VNRYLAQPIMPEDIVHSYSGIRSLYDDGSDRASEITRDYMLDLDRRDGAPLLSVFGGKITTYRRLSEQVLEKLAPFLPTMAPEWTAARPLPGGDIPGGDFQSFEVEVCARWPFLPPATARRLSRAYGTRLDRVMGNARSLAEMGEDFGGGLSASEVDYLIEHEWARTAEDIIWRRSKLGLHLEPGNVTRLSAYLANEAKLPEQAHG
jgi:glycerol-3-phosphate dehydrogenase